jgi:putative oxidoreductase
MFCMNHRSVLSVTAQVFGSLSRAIWIPALLTRLFVGYFFFTSGWSKVHDLATFTSNFQSWGIPDPAFNATLSAYTECIGGALTITGLGMRFVSIPMIINMTVAVLSVKLKEVSGLVDFVNLDEPLYALVYLWLLFGGAGWLSIDAILKVLVDAYLGLGDSEIEGNGSNLSVAEVNVERETFKHRSANASRTAAIR